MIHLGVAGLTPLPAFAHDDGRWDALERKLAVRPFFHSDGLSTLLGAPQRLTGPLKTQCEEVVARFDAFYDGVIARYYAEPEARDEYMVNPFFDRALKADRDTRTSLPLARLDCVLCEDGVLRVIEINPVGVCTIHLRATTYLARTFRREGLLAEAELVDTLYDQMLGSFERFYARERPGEPARPRVVGNPHLPNLQRGSRVTFRHAFSRHGWRYVEGLVNEFEVRDDGLWCKGERIDVLWGDWLFYLGYQYVRYQETRWASSFGDYSRACEASAVLLDDPRVLEHLRTRRLLQLSPPKSYVALSKNLLSWIHREDRPAGSAQERAWLKDHVARTYGVRDRQEGALTVSDAIRDRERFLLKPCQYGGAHGVVLGRDAEPGAWASLVEEKWSDPAWALQEYHEPVRTPCGQWISFGLYAYAGQLGGVTLRTADTRLISARKSAFIPVVTAR